MKRLILISTIVVLSGCAPMIFTHPDKDQSDFNRDKYECTKIAEQSVCSRGACGNIFMMIDEIQQCLQLKFGWRAQR